jgi:hypothetical protein
MRPDDRELDDEIRGHLALNVKERIENGDDPEAARHRGQRRDLQRVRGVLSSIPLLRQSE